MKESVPSKTEGVAKKEGIREPITSEFLTSREYVDIPVQGNFKPVIDALNIYLGTELAPRPDGFHVTLFDLKEASKLEELDKNGKITPVVLKTLNELNASIQDGKGINVVGVGFIDGSSSKLNLRKVDRAKKAAYVILDCPRLKWIRRELGFDYTDENGGEHEKDLRLTLGYEVGDLRYQIIGTDFSTGKDILGQIPRDVDTSAFAAQDKVTQILNKVVGMKFGEIDGPDKKTKGKK